MSFSDSPFFFFEDTNFDGASLFISITVSLSLSASYVLHICFVSFTLSPSLPLFSVCVLPCAPPVSRILPALHRLSFLLSSALLHSLVLSQCISIFLLFQSLFQFAFTVYVVSLTLVIFSTVALIVCCVFLDMLSLSIGVIWAPLSKRSIGVHSSYSLPWHSAGSSLCADTLTFDQ